MTIRLKLIIAFLSTIVSLVAAISYAVIVQSLINAERDFVYHAQQKMRLVNGTYDSFFTSVGQDVRHLAGNHLYRDLDRPLSTYMGDAPKATDAQDVGGMEAIIEQFFEDYAANRPHLRDIYFATTDGGFVGLLDDPLSNYDPRERPWYRSALANPGRAAVSQPYFSPGSGPMISVSTPVLSADGSLLGVQSADVTLTELTALVRSATMGQTGYIMLIDSEGTIVSDPRHEEYLFQNVAEIDDPLYAALANPSDTSFDIIAGGEDRMVTIYDAETSGLRFVAIMDKAEIVSNQWPMLREILMIAAVLAIVFIVVAIFIATRITRPIRHVTASLKSLAEGDATLTDELPVTGNGEIRELATWFNRFLESVRGNQEEHLRAQKLEAIGQLAAGIAHEINTPTQYVSDNVAFLGDALDDLKPVLSAYEELARDAAGSGSGRLEHYREIAAKADLEYLAEEIPQALSQSRDGLAQVKKIVRAMKSFSHPGDEKKPFNLNESIESTVTVARNEWKFVADVDLQLDDDLPAVNCVPSGINQVVLNLVVNAAHAIGDSVSGKADDKGRITITTRADGSDAVITIADTGCGIPEELVNKIFDPFFTTKEVGKGTGQGLALAHDIIVKDHGGSIQVESEPGSGTTFIIRLPLGDSGQTAAETGPAIAAAIA